MPIYEYKCEDCSKVFEVFLGIKDKPIRQCIHCNGKNIRKLISNCSFQLKGTGWYLTDYARKDIKNETTQAKHEGKSEASEGSQTSEKKDTKKVAEGSKDAGKAA